MKFRVERTSSLFGRTPRPCAGAKLLNPDAPEWEWGVWEIELNTLEEFMDFVKKNGEVVVYNENDEWECIPESGEQQPIIQKIR